MANARKILPGKYRHFKGKFYRVYGLARHSETLEDYVVYQALYGDGALWTRPADMWDEIVETGSGSVPRFEYLGAEDEDFWTLLDRLIARSEMKIDRPKGSSHPRYPDRVYPLDYGYLSGTLSADGEGVDLWHGTAAGDGLSGLLVVADLLKRDSEIKLLIDCTEEEASSALDFHNATEFMKGIRIDRKRGLVK